MTQLPVAGHISDNVRTEVEVKTDLEDTIQAIKEGVGQAAEATVVISSGNVTPTTASIVVDTEASASTDDLSNVLTTNMPEGRIIFVRAADASRKVTVKHLAGGSGEIENIFGADVLLNKRTIMALQLRGTRWVQIWETRIGEGACGTSSDYWGGTVPASSVLGYGQLVNVADEPEYASRVGDQFGGDGINTVGIPDLRDRATVGKGNMGGTAANRITLAGAGIDTTVLGATGGAQTITLAEAHIPAHTPTFTGSALAGHLHSFTGNSLANHTHNISPQAAQFTGNQADGGGFGTCQNGAGSTQGASAGTPSGSISSVSAGTPAGTISSFGGGQAHGNVQPIIATNKIVWL